jgi:hypothetical protein
MANKFNGFLNNVGQGLLGPKGNLGDFQHASRLYVGNAFRLAPKVKFLYHVHFELGPTVKSNLKKFNTELDMLVKNADLPKFQVATVEQRNQYNRKRNLVQKIEYSPVNITFHDDNLHLTTQLWKQYYAYMFADHNTARITGAYNRTAYLDQPLGVSYGMDNNASAPFFTSITLYQLSRQTFQSFKLIAPIITQWSHDTVDQGDGGGVSENQMSVAYESVVYSNGRVSQGNPDGFAQLYYDTVPSPLSLQGGGGSNTIFGEDGILEGFADVIGDFSDGDFASNPLGTIVKGINLFKNAQNVSKESIRNEGFGILKEVIGDATGAPVSGVGNIAFPKNSGTGGSNISTAQAALLGVGVLANVFKGKSESDARQQIEDNPGLAEDLARRTTFQQQMQQQGIGNLNDQNDAWDQLNQNQKNGFVERTKNNFTNIYKGIVV